MSVINAHSRSLTKNNNFYLLSADVRPATASDVPIKHISTLASSTYQPGAYLGGHCAGTPFGGEKKICTNIYCEKIFMLNAEHF